MLQRCGYRLSCWLSCPRPPGETEGETAGWIATCLCPGDVLLVEGTSRFSTVIKYLTQSSWSHAALYVGKSQVGMHRFIEADVAEGVRVVGLDEFEGYNLRLCRPVGLSNKDIGSLIDFAEKRVGHQYDLRNILDLARYLLPLPPVPDSWRRTMLGLGSGDPTRAICSTLIAQAFQSINYPILPVENWEADELLCQGCRRKIFRRRHYTLFTPRDFDISPYFDIVKPRLVGGFNPYLMLWREDASSGSPRVSSE